MSENTNAELIKTYRIMNGRLSTLKKKYSEYDIKDGARALTYVLPVPGDEYLVGKDKYRIAFLGIKVGDHNSLRELDDIRNFMVQHEFKIQGSQRGSRQGYIPHSTLHISHNKKESWIDTPHKNLSWDSAYKTVNEQQEQQGGALDSCRATYLLNSNNSSRIYLKRMTANLNPLKPLKDMIRTTTVPINYYKFIENVMNREGCSEAYAGLDFFAHPLYPGFDIVNNPTEIKYSQTMSDFVGNYRVRDNARDQLATTNLMTDPFRTGINQFQGFSFNGLNGTDAHKYCLISFSFVLLDATIEENKAYTSPKTPRSGRKHIVDNPIMVGDKLLSGKIKIRRNAFNLGYNKKGKLYKKGKLSIDPSYGFEVSEYNIYDPRIRPIFMRQHQSYNLTEELISKLQKGEDINAIDHFDQFLLDFQKVLNELGVVIFMPISFPITKPNAISQELGRGKIGTPKFEYTRNYFLKQLHELKIHHNKMTDAEAITKLLGPSGTLEGIRDLNFRRYFNRFFKGYKEGKATEVAYAKGENGQIIAFPENAPFNYDAILELLFKGIAVPRSEEPIYLAPSKSENSEKVYTEVNFRGGSNRKRKTQKKAEKKAKRKNKKRGETLKNQQKTKKRKRRSHHKK